MGDAWIDHVIMDWYHEVMQRSKSARIEVNLGMPMEYYQKLQDAPPRFIIGADEVGRGPLAGPVTVAAFLAPVDWNMVGVQDSKNFRVPSKRAELLPKLMAQGASCIRSSTNLEIDKWGINFATQLALEDCFEFLRDTYPTEFEQAFIVTDAGLRARHVDHASFPKADGIVPHVSAASIIAKVSRDGWMLTEAHHKYPAYDFGSNAGYASPKHEAGLATHGPCPLHRLTFLKGRAVQGAEEVT